ncbi:alcohol dehydrogenase catalytic domain-containing protein [Candidatus Gottesmanbacteria bacterium]|nr:alcohol dehydrogenase catalytic domain-containing protein [Candidatus Gottesmanbacteria bacterium]
MKAVQIHSYGGNDVFVVHTDVPPPTPKDGQLLIQVSAASLNLFDLVVRAGYLQKMMPLQFPVTMGGDFSGTVTALGTGAGDFHRGDEVYGQAIIFNGGSGSFAEFLAANSKNVAHKPKITNLIEAAALPLVGTSAVQALEEHIKLQSG